MINKTLSRTINQTTVEVLQTIKDFPKNTARNMLCFAPNIISKIRNINAMENSSTFQRRYLADLQRISGNFSTYTIISYLISKYTYFRIIMAILHSLFIILQAYRAERNEASPGIWKEHSNESNEDLKTLSIHTVLI